MRQWLIDRVARIPVRVHAKLLAAFLVIVALLVVVGAVGPRGAERRQRRAEDLVKLQRKIAAYRQLQHDTTAQLYSVASALLVPEERTLEATLRQLNQFGYDLDRLQFVAKDEVELLGQVREDYEKFIGVVTRVIELIRGGRGAEGRELQLKQAGPLADRLERLTNELVNKAEADMVASIEAGDAAYARSRWIVIGFVVGSIGLALVLGYAISWSLIDPVTPDGRAAARDRRRRFLPARDGREPRRAGDAGRQPQPHERRARPALRPARGRQPPQVGVPRQHVARAAHAAQRGHRVLGSAAGAHVRRAERQAGAVRRRSSSARDAICSPSSTTSSTSPRSRPGAWSSS